MSSCSSSSSPASPVPTTTTYSVGTCLDIWWPNADGSSSWSRAKIGNRKRKAISRSRHISSEYRYELVWKDGDPPNWSRLLHLPHAIVDSEEEGEENEMWKLSEPLSFSSSSSSSSSSSTSPTKKGRFVTQPFSNISANIGKLNSSISRKFPWVCEEGDHFESPFRAIRDICTVLEEMALLLGKTKESLRIYDPYYCDGAVVHEFGKLGFSSVYNKPEDFYRVWKDGKGPEFDVLVTNPPFGEEHVIKLFEFVEWCGKPWCILLPDQFTTLSTTAPFLTRSKVFFVVSPKRYKFKSPKKLRPGRSNAQRRYTSPTFTYWYCSVNGNGIRGKLLKWWEKRKQKERKRAAAVVISEDNSDKQCVFLADGVEGLPAFAKSSDKSSPLAVFRKQFNNFCRENKLGRLCVDFVVNGKCGCDQLPTSPFVHPREAAMRDIKPKLRQYMATASTVVPSEYQRINEN